jgi:hypothetical protein
MTCVLIYAHINMSSAYISYVKRVICFLSLCSGLFLFLKSMEIISEYWVICLIPVLCGMTIIPIVTYYTIYEYCLISDSFVFYFLQFCCINISAFISIFMILISLKADDFISCNYCSIFISLWYSIAVYILLCGFLMPGLSGTGMKREAWVMIVWGSGAMGSSILLPIWLDDLWGNWWMPLVPILLAWVGTVLIYLYILIINTVLPGREGLFYIFIISLLINTTLQLEKWNFVISAVYILIEWILLELEKDITYKTV